MLRNIFKTILVLSLSLGISLPINAAVSVSDGSAFVTKAEFAADLNNLSNRMAQLENSLDAKIDSLVSSYLTRNGIWNGAKQTLAYNKCETPYSRKKYDGSYNSDSDAQKPGNNIYDRWEYKIVNESNKTGMVYLRYFHDYDIDGSSEMTGLGDNMAYIGFTLAVEQWSGSSVTNSPGNRWGWQMFYYTNMGHQGYNGNCTFFVSKGQPIYLYTYHKTSPNNTTAPTVYLYLNEIQILELLVY